MNQPHNHKYFNLISMLILVNSICSSMLGIRLLNLNLDILGTYDVSGGIIPFCLSFMLLDIALNQYGYRCCKQIIYNLLICKTFFVLILYFILQLKTNEKFIYESSYQLVFNAMLKTFLSSMIGTICAFFLNCVVFSKMYISFNGKYLWLRCLISTTLGEIVFSLVSTPILFFGKLNLYDIFLLMFHNYSFKIIFELFSLPVIYLVLFILEKYEIKQDITYNGFYPVHKELSNVYGNNND